MGSDLLNSVMAELYHYHLGSGSDSCSDNFHYIKYYQYLLDWIVARK